MVTMPSFSGLLHSGVATTAILGTLSLASPQSGSQDDSSRGIILRDLAAPRFFGAAANTSWLYHDVNYTKVISTQVS